MVVVDMNKSWTRGHNSYCYEQPRAFDDINDFESWAQGFKYYE